MVDEVDVAVTIDVPRSTATWTAALEGGVASLALGSGQAASAFAIQNLDFSVTHTLVDVFFVTEFNGDLYLFEPFEYMNGVDDTNLGYRLHSGSL